MSDARYIRGTLARIPTDPKLYRVTAVSADRDSIGFCVNVWNDSERMAGDRWADWSLLGTAEFDRTTGDLKGFRVSVTFNSGSMGFGSGLHLNAPPKVVTATKRAALKMDWAAFVREHDWATSRVWFRPRKVA